MSELGGLLLLTVGFGALGGTGALVACCLRLRSAVSYVLAAYLIAWTEVVAVAFVLRRTLGRALDAGRSISPDPRRSASGLARTRSTTPARPPCRRPPGAALRLPRIRWSRSPLLASIAALSYTLVLTLTTPPNDGDPLAYELARAAFWRQEQAS